MEDLEVQVATRRAIQAGAEAMLADLRPARARWKEALRDSEPLPRSPEHSPWSKRAIGTGLDRRVKRLLALDLIPARIPERPPWRRYDLFALPLWSDDDCLDRAPTEDDYSRWAAGALERQADAQSWVERTGSGSLAAADPMAPVLGAPVPASMIAELDALTELAHERFVLPHASLPIERRRPMLVPCDGAHYWLTLDSVDLFLDHRLCEIKTLDTATLDRRTFAQLTRNLLYDTNDRYDASALGVYESRRGVLVWFDLGEVVEGGYDRLQACRQELRPQIETITQRFGPPRYQSDPAQARFEVY